MKTTDKIPKFYTFASNTGKCKNGKDISDIGTHVRQIVPPNFRKLAEKQTPRKPNENTKRSSQQAESKRNAKSPLPERKQNFHPNLAHIITEKYSKKCKQRQPKKRAKPNKPTHEYLSESWHFHRERFYFCHNSFRKKKQDNMKADKIHTNENHR